MKRICVFCGSSNGAKPIYREAAVQCGRAIVESGIELVYGGGNIGLMGALADAALEADGRVIGIIPDGLLRREVGHLHLSELHIVNSMHERKAMMADLSDGFIALPGGYGTFEEFFEIVTWAQLGMHRKPCGLLNVAGYYDPMLTMIDRANQEKFLRPQHRDLVLVGANIDELLSLMVHYSPPPSLEKWIDRRTT
jgi:uncharacterized protein (TIGR00730 family)